MSSVNIIKITADSADKLARFIAERMPSAVGGTYTMKMTSRRSSGHRPNAPKSDKSTASKRVDWYLKITAANGNCLNFHKSESIRSVRALMELLSAHYKMPSSDPAECSTIIADTIEEAQAVHRAIIASSPAPAVVSEPFVDNSPAAAAAAAPAAAPSSALVLQGMPLPAAAVPSAMMIDSQ